MSKEVVISDLAGLLLKYPTGTLLTCTEEEHYKFWHCVKEGKKVHIHWGRIGAAPQGQTQEFMGDSSAISFMGKKISEKEKKGYKRVR